ncbi:MAG: hypothetical protein KGZ45_03540 [Clostridium sp.]|nr:hypothetical protein [Clostridium sp.]
MDKDMFKLADLLKCLKDEKKRMEAELKDVNVSIEETENRLSEMMIDTETQSFNRSGTLFYLSTRLYASTLAEKKQDLFEALKKYGFGSLVVETVNANSLSAFVKEQIAENEDQLPVWLDGKVNVFEKTSIGIRKAK